MQGGERMPTAHCPLPMLRRIPITREGWYYLVVLGLILGGAMLREVNLLLMLAGILLGPVVYSLLAVRRTLAGLRVERRMPRSVCAGDLLVVHLIVTNPRRRLGAWGVAVEDCLQRRSRPDETASGRPAARPSLSAPPPAARGEEPLRPPVLFPYVAAGQSVKAAYRARLPRRGRYDLGPLRLSTRFPFGLFERTVVVPAEGSLVVYPRLGRLTRLWAARRREAFAGTHRRERRHGAEGDFYGVRGWHDGDSLRWVHWRTTARTGNLSVRQFEQPRNRDVAVLLDLWQPPTPTPLQRENVELAVGFAATVLADLCRKGGSNVHLAALDPGPSHLGGPASPPLLEAMMERLALVEPLDDDRLDELLGHALGRVEPGTELVLVSTRAVELPDAGGPAGPGTDAVRRAMLRGLRVVDVSNPKLDDYFRAE
jgi:uncharacterized protein (DUF58 family)